MFFDEEVAGQIKERFSEMVHPVKLVVFSQMLEHPESEEVKRLVEELATLDPRVIVEARNFAIDAALAKDLGVERIPAIAILRAGVDGAADHDYGVRFFGLPMQYDFGVLIDAIVDVSRGESGLDPATLEALNGLTRPVHLQVFSTPT
jgi:alkyl hydroperoxide reductase subunit AhpF